MGADGYRLAGEMDVNVAVGIIAALILASQLIVMQRQSDLLEVDALRSLREEWRRLRSAWIVTVAVGGSMYVDIDNGVLQDYPSATAIAERLNEVDLILRPAVFKNGPPSKELSQATRDTLEFLAWVSGLILRGRISPGTAYEALGATVVKNGANLRRLLDEPSRSSYYVSYYPGTRRRVLILLDLLWVESLRASDVDQHTAAKALVAKIEHGSGARNRRRARREAIQFAGWLRGVAIEWYLTEAEVDAVSRRFTRIARRLERYVFHTRVAPELEGMPPPPDYPDKVFI